MVRSGCPLAAPVLLEDQGGVEEEYAGDAELEQADRTTIQTIEYRRLNVLRNGSRSMRDFNRFKANRLEA